jgi:hypothetical protein
MLAEQLQHALTSRIVIEQAKGVLAERGNLGMEQAFDRLRRYARNTNTRLTDVARRVVEGTLDSHNVLTHPAGPPPATLTRPGRPPCPDGRPDSRPALESVASGPLSVSRCTVAACHPAQPETIRPTPGEHLHRRTAHYDVICWIATDRGPGRTVAPARLPARTSGRAPGRHSSVTRPPRSLGITQRKLHGPCAACWGNSTSCPRPALDLHGQPR